MSSRSENPRRRLSLSTISVLLAGTIRVYDLQLNDLLADCKDFLYQQIGTDHDDSSRTETLSEEQIQDSTEVDSGSSEEIQKKMVSSPVEHTPSSIDQVKLNLYISEARKVASKIQMSWSDFEMQRRSDSQVVLVEQPKRKRRRTRGAFKKRVVDQSWRQRRADAEALMKRYSHSLGRTLHSLCDANLEHFSIRASVDRDFFTSSPVHPQMDSGAVEDLQLRKNVYESEEIFDQSQQLVDRTTSIFCAESSSRSSTAHENPERRVPSPHDRRNRSSDLLRIIFADDYLFSQVIEEEYAVSKCRNVAIVVKPQTRDVSTATPTVITKDVGIPAKNKIRAISMYSDR